MRWGLALLLAGSIGITAEAQEGTSIIVGGTCSDRTPQYCFTPEDRARLARDRADAARREQAAKAAAIQKEQAIQSMGLPPGRRAEAEKLYEMQQASRKARGLPDTAPATTASASTGTAASPGNDAVATAARKQTAAQAEKERREAAERARSEREQAEADAKKAHAEALRRHLAAEQAGIRLRAMACGREATIIGIRPAVSPRVANCIVVHYEARCPAQQPGQGIRQSFWNYVGGNSCYGDTQKLQRPLPCKPEEAIVVVQSVTTC